jgi:hypothetical protein
MSKNEKNQQAVKKDSNLDLNSPVKSDKKSASVEFHKEIPMTDQNEKKYNRCVNEIINIEIQEQDGTPPDQELINSILDALPQNLKQAEPEVSKPINVKKDKVQNYDPDIEVEIKIDAFIGILSKCFIDDCEYHIIQNKHMIHYKENEATPKAFIRARDYFRQNSTNSDVMILVFADRLEIVAADGSSKEVK